jgi:hypothetical protein
MQSQCRRRRCVCPSNDVLPPATHFFVGPASTYRFILSPPRCPFPSAPPVSSSPSPTRPAGSDADADTSRVIRTGYTSGYNFTPAQNGSRSCRPNPCHPLPILSPLSRYHIALPLNSAPRLLALAFTPTPTVKYGARQAENQPRQSEDSRTEIMTLNSRILASHCFIEAAPVNFVHLPTL